VNYEDMTVPDLITFIAQTHLKEEHMTQSQPRMGLIIITQV